MNSGTMKSFTSSMYREAVDDITGRIAVQPKIGMILGSGLGVLADEVSERVVVPYSEIPHFPQSTVEGHAGQLVTGLLGSVPVLVMQGRFHYYEGYSMDAVTFPIRVMKLLGIDDLLITNAAGGCNPAFSVGDLMVITDHIKFFDESPLRGPNAGEFGPRFNDMGDAYTKSLREGALAVGKELGIELQQGVYAHMAGPSFETPAEIRMLQVLGADACGMSTVPEVIVAAHASMRVLGISCITNMAAGILDQPLSQEEVMETGRAVRETFSRLIRGIIAAW